MEKGAGAGGVATEMAVGLAMAKQMMQQGFTDAGPAVSPKPGTAAAGGGGVSGGALPELLSPGDVANALKVSEGDVLAILESGELPGKKIGSTWRIKRSALDEYLAK
jgi:excisionase family DNA binding protein